MAESKTELRIVLLGKTGTGKSKTGNTILRLTKNSDPTHFIFACKGSSETKKCEGKEKYRFGRKVKVIDTPGVFDTDSTLTNYSTQQEVKRSIVLSYPGPHALVLTVKMGRFTSEDANTLKHYIQYFGIEILNYVIIIFTSYDLFESDYLEQELPIPGMDEHLETLPPYLADFIKCCKNRFLTFNNKTDDDEQALKLFSMIDQMVVENNGICYTNEYYQQASVILESVSSIKELERKMVDGNWLRRLFSRIKLIFLQKPPDHPLLKWSDYQL